jgi:hypothetical protein
MPHHYGGGTNEHCQRFSLRYVARKYNVSPYINCVQQFARLPLPPSVPCLRCINLRFLSTLRLYTMPKGRKSPFNANQLAEVASYIPKFEQQVHKHDPKMQGDGKKALTKWKQRRADKIIKKPAFKDMPKEYASEWKKVRLVSGVLHFLTTMPLGYRSQVH